jgi:hypothetical protein
MKKGRGRSFRLNIVLSDEIDEVAKEGLRSGSLDAYFIYRIPLFVGIEVIFHHGNRITVILKNDRPTEMSLLQVGANILRISK